MVTAHVTGCEVMDETVKTHTRQKHYVTWVVIKILLVPSVYKNSNLL